MDLSTARCVSEHAGALKAFLACALPVRRLVTAIAKAASMNGDSVFTERQISAALCRSPTATPAAWAARSQASRRLGRSWMENDLMAVSRSVRAAAPRRPIGAAGDKNFAALFTDPADILRSRRQHSRSQIHFGRFDPEEYLPLR